MCFRLPDSFNYDFRCRGELSAEHRKWSPAKRMGEPGTRAHYYSYLIAMSCLAVKKNINPLEKGKENGKTPLRGYS